MLRIFYKSNIGTPSEMISIPSSSINLRPFWKWGLEVCGVPRPPPQSQHQIFKGGVCFLFVAVTDTDDVWRLCQNQPKTQKHREEARFHHLRPNLDYWEGCNKICSCYTKLFASLKKKHERKRFYLFINQKKWKEKSVIKKKMRKIAEKLTNGKKLHVKKKIKK